MRDFLKPSEYAILKATLPLVAVLQCNSHGPCFVHFWQLPEKVRTHISVHHAREQDFQGRHLVGQMNRFEVYKSESGEEDMLILAFSQIETCEYIECVGQYCGGVFVRQPYPVSQTMVAKATAMSQARWSWSQIPNSDRSWVYAGWFLAFFGLAAWAGMVYFGPSYLWDYFHSIHVESSFGVVFTFAYIIVLFPVSLLGLTYSILPVLSSWWEHRQKQSFLSNELRWLAGDVVLG